MSILNYFFIGAAFTFLIDLILGMKRVQNHPKIKKVLDINWTLESRIACIIIWPISILVFLISFVKAIFK